MYLLISFYIWDEERQMFMRNEITFYQDGGLLRSCQSLDKNTFISYMDFNVEMLEELIKDIDEGRA